MNNSNQIIIATAVVGGLLIGAPDAMAQGTYSSNTTTVTTVTTQATTAINQVNPATGVTATQPIATTLTSTTGTSAVVVTAPGANVQVGKDAAGNVLTASGPALRRRWSPVLRRRPSTPPRRGRERRPP